MAYSLTRGINIRLPLLLKLIGEYHFHFTIFHLQFSRIPLSLTQSSLGSTRSSFCRCKPQVVQEMRQDHKPHRQFHAPLAFRGTACSKIHCPAGWTRLTALGSYDNTRILRQIRIQGVQLVRSFSGVLFCRCLLLSPTDNPNAMSGLGSMGL